MSAASAEASDAEVGPLPAGLTAQGWVVDGLGGPIAGAALTARSAPGGALEASSLSAADGRFRLGVVSRSVELCAELDGYSLDCIQTAAPSTDNELRLLPASGIIGRVVMAGSGAAVAGAIVEATNRVGPHSRPRSIRTDDEGAFSIAALPAGSYTLTAVSPTARSREASVVLGIGETSDPVLLVSTPAVQVSAEVTVGDVPCRSGRLRMSGHSFFDAEVMDEGAALISGVLPGRYAAIVTCEGGLTPSPTPVEIGDAPVHYVWKLEPRPRHEPSADDTAVDTSLATIVAHVDGAVDGIGELQVFAEARGLPPQRARREGERFVFAPMPLGEYRVYAADRLEEAVSVELANAGEAVVVALRLSAGASLSGVVLDDHDAPVADAWVSRARADLPGVYNPGPVLTDVDGRFFFAAAKDVAYRLTVSSPAGDAVMEGVKGENVVVRVARPGSVAGTVWAPAHGLVPEFTVELEPHHGRQIHEVRGVDSRFFVPALEPGEYELTLRSPLGAATRMLLVAPGEELALEIELGAALE